MISSRRRCRGGRRGGRCHIVVAVSLAAAQTSLAIEPLLVAAILVVAVVVALARRDEWQGDKSKRRV